VARAALRLDGAGDSSGVFPALHQGLHQLRLARQERTRHDQHKEIVAAMQTAWKNRKL